MEDSTDKPNYYNISPIYSSPRRQKEFENSPKSSKNCQDDLSQRLSASLSYHDSLNFNNSTVELRSHDHEYTDLNFVSGPANAQAAYGKIKSSKTPKKMSKNKLSNSTTSIFGSWMRKKTKADDFTSKNKSDNKSGNEELVPANRKSKRKLSAPVSPVKYENVSKENLGGFPRAMSGISWKFDGALPSGDQNNSDLGKCGASKSLNDIVPPVVDVYSDNLDEQLGTDMNDYSDLEFEAPSKTLPNTNTVHNMCYPILEETNFIRKRDRLNVSDTIVRTEEYFGSHLSPFGMVLDSEYKPKDEEEIEVEPKFRSRISYVRNASRSTGCISKNAEDKCDRLDSDTKGIHGKLDYFDHKTSESYKSNCSSLNPYENWSLQSSDVLTQSESSYSHTTENPMIRNFLIDSSSTKSHDVTVPQCFTNDLYLLHSRGDVNPSDTLSGLSKALHHSEMTSRIDNNEKSRKRFSATSDSFGQFNFDPGSFDVKTFKDLLNVDESRIKESYLGELEKIQDLKKQLVEWRRKSTWLQNSQKNKKG